MTISWKKLKFYGIRGKTNTWIRDFLSNRRKCVVVDGEKSYEAEVKSRVSNGFMLGPSLFLFYTNDIEDNMESTVRLFGDDIIVYLTVSSTQDAETLLNDLKSLEFKKEMAHGIAPREIPSPHNNQKEETPSVRLHQHGHTSEHVESVKYLAITMTKDFRWNTHI